MKCELLQLFLFPALGTSALLDPGSGSGVGVGSGLDPDLRGGEGEVRLTMTQY